MSAFVKQFWTMFFKFYRDLCTAELCTVSIELKLFVVQYIHNNRGFLIGMCTNCEKKLNLMELEEVTVGSVAETFENLHLVSVR